MAGTISFVTTSFGMGKSHARLHVTGTLSGAMARWHVALGNSAEVQGADIIAPP
jgi:hypothetical protein